MKGKVVAFKYRLQFGKGKLSRIFFIDLIRKRYLFGFSLDTQKFNIGAGKTKGVS
ncbi:MAG: hypothetical protein GX811_04380 [Lentisphaerae bacterium]|jgi:hypothetical protein|nr:hypothetical protein [Lentisphaerota bacterium]